MSVHKKCIIVTGTLCLSALLWTSSAFAAQVTVQKNDTLWAIARKHGTTVEVIKKLNNLKSDLIYPGQVLKLPDSTGQTNGQAQKGQTASRSAGRVEELLKFAESLKGIKYAYGGTSPATGFDCSGYVYYVFKRFGIELVHSSAGQYKNHGIPVERKDLQPADLVFFNTSGKGVSHVGIYLGNDEFIHASSPGSYVKVSSLNDKYWATRYVGAKRIILE